MDTPDQHFFSAISQFKSQDFGDSSNPEMLYLKSLIEGGEGELVTAPTMAPAMLDPSPEPTIGSVSEHVKTSQPEEIQLLMSNPFNAPDDKQNLSTGASMPSNYELRPEFSYEQPQPVPTYPISPRDGLFFHQEHEAPLPLPTPPNPQPPPQQQQQPPQQFMLPFNYPLIEEPIQHCQPSESPHGSMIKRMKLVEVEIAPTMHISLSYPKRAHVMKRETLSDNGSAETMNDSDSEDVIRRFPASIHGETRLNIKFSNKGTLGQIPQRFGKNSCYIPDGLAGKHQMYDQKWRFEVHHEYQSGAVLIRWVIHNETSGKTTSTIETVQDALNREGCGRTICNNVLKKAMDDRAKELEDSLAAMGPGNAQRAANMRTLIKSLRPKRCTVGLLFFGLLHEEIQTLMAKQELSQSSQIPSRNYPLL